MTDRKVRKSKHYRSGEAKTEKHSFRFTPTGWKGLETLAESLGISVNELLDQIGQHKIPLQL